MVNANDGGGSGYGFDPGDTSAQYHNYDLTGQGVEPFSNEDFVLHWTTHSFAGYEYNDGRADALRKVKSGIDMQSLHDKTSAWETIQSHTQDIHSRLASAYKATFAAWSGDDADKAEKTFGLAVDSAAAMNGQAETMHAGMTQISKGAQKLVGTGSDGPSGWGQVANWSLGADVASGDGDNAVGAYDDFVSTLQGGRDTMPANYTWQVKTTPGPSGTNPYAGTDTGTGGNGGGGVGGVTAPHAGGSATHSAVGTPQMVKNPYVDTDTNHGGGTRPPKEPPVHIEHPITDTPVTSSNPYSGGSGIGSDGTPGLDTGSSLAGYDPSGGAGGAGIGGGAGGIGAGGGVGGGIGAGGGIGGGIGGGAGIGAGGGLAGAGGGLAGGSSGLGSGGVGGGGLGAEGAEGAEAAEAAGAAGRGGVGLPGQGVPRGVGGSGGDESERERSTWLTEEDDVWGESDAPPSVIS